MVNLSEAFAIKLSIHNPKKKVRPITMLNGKKLKHTETQKSLDDMDRVCKFLLWL